MTGGKRIARDQKTLEVVLRYMSDESENDVCWTPGQ